MLLLLGEADPTSAGPLCARCHSQTDVPRPHPLPSIPITIYVHALACHCCTPRLMHFCAFIFICISNRFVIIMDTAVHLLGAQVCIATVVLSHVNSLTCRVTSEQRCVIFIVYGKFIGRHCDAACVCSIV